MLKQNIRTAECFDLAMTVCPCSRHHSVSIVQKIFSNNFSRLMKLLTCEDTKTNITS